jgi:hypothetical protein
LRKPEIKKKRRSFVWPQMVTKIDQFWEREREREREHDTCRV